MDSFIKYTIPVILSIIIILVISVIGVGLYNTFQKSEPNSVNLTNKDTNKTTDNTDHSNLAARNPTKAKSNTADITRSNNIDYSKIVAERKGIYAKLKATCDKWTQWYKKDRDNTARINMNTACREAKLYAANELGINTGKANYSALTTTHTKNTNPTKRTLTNNSAHCNSWENQLKTVQSQLRAGYKEPKGNRLREQRRALSEKIRENC
jgi:hypothetical protein